MELARSWLSDCKRHHQACKGIGNTLRRPPTRLIHVLKSRHGDNSRNLEIKLVEINLQSGPIEYLALSHCWGGTNTLRLLNENYEFCKEAISFSALSKNMRDAIIIVTQKLGYYYIWIDFLCIIQDSVDDWRAEAARMETVYAGAACTLASMASESGDGGCFDSRSPRALRFCKVRASQSWLN